MKLAHLFSKQRLSHWKSKYITDLSLTRLVVLTQPGEFYYAANIWPGGPDTLQELVATDSVDQLRDAYAAALAEGRTPEEIDSSLGWAPAVLQPPQIVAVGLNYTEHREELDLQKQKNPVLFSYWLNSLTGHESTLSWPKNLSQKVDYEAELGVIIGKPARNVKVSEALDYVFGYTAVNDVTARDLQLQESQWVHAKSFDDFTPVGPVVTTANQIPDPQNLTIQCRLDGRLVQNASTASMVFSVAELIAYISNSTTLLPGALISTGSPGGSGHARNPQVFMRDGSVVEVILESVGCLRNYCRSLE